jgi:hypothetical protein
LVQFSGDCAFTKTTPSLASASIAGASTRLFASYGRKVRARMVSISSTMALSTGGGGLTFCSGTTIAGLAHATLPVPSPASSSRTTWPA